MTRYAYDKANRLLAIQRGETLTAYRYDEAGQVIQQDALGFTTRISCWDGLSEVTHAVLASY